MLKIGVRDVWAFLSVGAPNLNSCLVGGDFLSLAKIKSDKFGKATIPMRHCVWVRKADGCWSSVSKSRHVSPQQGRRSARDITSGFSFATLFTCAHVRARRTCDAYRWQSETKRRRSVGTPGHWTIFVRTQVSTCATLLDYKMNVPGVIIQCIYMNIYMLNMLRILRPLTMEIEQTSYTIFAALNLNE